MNARQARRAAETAKAEFDRGFQAGIDSTQAFMYQYLFAAAALAARREYKFGPERVKRLLSAMDKIIIETLDSEEALQKVWEEVGVHLHFKDGIDPVKLNSEEDDD